MTKPNFLVCSFIHLPLRNSAGGIHSKTVQTPVCFYQVLEEACPHLPCMLYYVQNRARAGETRGGSLLFKWRHTEAPLWGGSLLSKWRDTGALLQQSLTSRALEALSSAVGVDALWNLLRKFFLVFPNWKHHCRAFIREESPSPAHSHSESWGGGVVLPEMLSESSSERLSDLCRQGEWGVPGNPAAAFSLDTLQRAFV